MCSLMSLVHSVKLRLQIYAPNHICVFIIVHLLAEGDCLFAFPFVASERAHWVTSQAPWLPPGPPWKEKEEGEPWGPRALPQSQKDDRLEGQTVPQTETCWEDPDEEDVSMRGSENTENGFVLFFLAVLSEPYNFWLVSLQHQNARTEEDQAEERWQDPRGSSASLPAGQRGTVSC